MHEPLQPPDGVIRVPVDPDILDLIPGFLENRRADARSLGEALSSGDLVEAARLGHAMKGVGGGYGFHEIARIGAAIEDAAEVGDTNAMGRLLGELERYLARIEPFPDPDAE